MGLLGMVIAVAIMVIGGWYLLFGSSHGHFTAENPGMTDNQKPTTDNSGPARGSLSSDSVRQAAPQSPAGQIASGMAAIDAAKNAVTQETADSRTAADAVNATDNRPVRSSSSSDSGGQQTTDDGSAGSGKVKAANAAKEAVQDRLVSFGYAVPKSPRTIDTVVIHSSYNSTGGDVYSVDKVIAIWKSYGVAPHYLIDRAGTVYRLVTDANVAYHAGSSKMPDGRTDVNDFSIGIEMLNTLTGQYMEAQYASVNALIATLKSEYPIRNVVGHSDIAPGRKTDPWNFDWKRLK